MKDLSSGQQTSPVLDVYNLLEGKKTSFNRHPKPYLRNPFCKSTSTNSKKQRKRLFKKFKGKCYYCKCDVYLPEVSNNELLTNTATIEHRYNIFDIRRAIVKNSSGYCVLACTTCNYTKGIRDADEFWKGYHYEFNSVNLLHIWLTGKVVSRNY
jgi:hypothetical protein